MAPSAIRVILALAPVALPAVFLVCAKRELARKTVAEARVSPPDKLVLDDEDEGVVPSDILDNAEEYVIARERVTSAPVPIADLRPEFIAKTDSELEGLLEAYLGATMRAFTWTPQALVMALMGSALGDPEGYRRTFEALYLSECRFEIGDRVCGVYVVRSRRRGRAVLGLLPPPGWKGPVVTGALNVGFDHIDGDKVKFVNETVMWRRVGEKPTLLEGSVGRWLHTLMASWLVVKGIGAVTGARVKNI
ncbi:hypothetical protein F4805DRAFT_478764 [Annulohypoxylon moriforme]|nr:hypothetical protein F4805DRAFT_478764 [Annulohypoxylon moriforme]